ncbi:uncharacterized protein AKAME5_001452200 [Lates japonicus]|uniref:Uncharacterized protein n=1 Tax=Lates japonicus TaxID=270547 RepID=A0AAD3MZK5_LATJO|nr:uncharacterized protein AKAME5_001452200 [Lates japonicus]
MICRILLLIVLISCVSGTLVVNVAQTFYQAEENHHITLEWTFTPKTLSSSNIYILSQQLTDQKVSVLFHLYEGVEVKTESGSNSDKCRLSVTGNHHVSCPTPPIEAEEGDVAELQCRLDPSVDLRKETLDFTRADLDNGVVHSYSFEKDQTDPQMDQYRIFIT